MRCPIDVYEVILVVLLALINYSGVWAVWWTSKLHVYSALAGVVLALILMFDVVVFAILVHSNRSEQANNPSEIVPSV